MLRLDQNIKNFEGNVQKSTPILTHKGDWPEFPTSPKKFSEKHPSDRMVLDVMSQSGNQGTTRVRIGSKECDD